MRGVLVTGASRGIGRAIALAFGAEGDRVAVNYLQSEDAALAVARQIGGVAIRADVGDPDEAARLVETAVTHLGRLDVVVNNAGIAASNLLVDVAPEEWNRMLAVHLTGAYGVCRAAIPHLLRGGGGRIIQIASIWGQTGAACEVAYSTAKAGQIGFTKALALELAKSGITVNCICPGFIDTDMNAGYTADERAELLDRTPARRFGRPEEVAAACVYLASPSAAYVTGQVLGVGGGIVM